MRETDQPDRFDVSVRELHVDPGREHAPRRRVEVTPDSIRIRKKILDHSQRGVARKKSAAQA